MKKTTQNKVSAAFAILILLFVAGISFADTTTTVTNSLGQVITVKTLGNVATDIKDADMYQDFSIYPSRLGEMGKIIRFYDIAACGVSTNARMLPLVKIPDNTLIRNGYYQVLVATDVVTTNNIRLNAAADIVGSATNKVGEAAGTRTAIIPVGTAATAVQATADRYLTFEITAGTPTTGRFMVVLDCELAP